MWIVQQTKISKHGGSRASNTVEAPKALIYVLEKARSELSTASCLHLPVYLRYLQSVCNLKPINFEDFAIRNRTCHCLRMGERITTRPFSYPEKKLSEKIWKNTYSTQFFTLSIMAVLVFSQKEQKFWEKEGNFKIWHFELTFEAPNETSATSPTTPVCLQNESFRMSYRWALYVEARGRHDFVVVVVVLLFVRA